MSPVALPRKSLYSCQDSMLALCGALPSARRTWATMSRSAMDTTNWGPKWDLKIFPYSWVCFCYSITNKEKQKSSITKENYHKGNWQFVIHNLSHLEFDPQPSRQGTVWNVRRSIWAFLWNIHKENREVTQFRTLPEKTQSSKAQSVSETKHWEDEKDMVHLKTHPLRSNRLERMSAKMKNVEAYWVKLTIQYKDVM